MRFPRPRVLRRVTRRHHRWVDTHAVTCVICGRLADERMTTHLTRDVTEIGPALAHDYPGRFHGIRALAQEYGEGEAHHECVQAALRRGVRIV